MASTHAAFPFGQPYVPTAGRPARDPRFDRDASPWGNDGPDANGLTPAAGRTPKMRVLFAFSSTNQMYSGIGRCIRELTVRLADRVQYEFAIDDHVPKNVAILKEFCDSHGIDVHVGPTRLVPECCEPLNEALPDLLRQRRWDAVEVVSWAGAGTQAMVLDAIGDAVLAYTPHYQPTWTVPMTEIQAWNIHDVHRRVLERADAVFCDSPWERKELQAGLPGRNNCVFLPCGCNFDDFEPGAWDRKFQLLFVGDLAEMRKRFDRVLAVFTRLHRRWPWLRLVIIGNKSDQARDRLPAEIRAVCDVRGYVSEAELRAAYAESRGLLMLSDYEAFGMPTLEALACGTPVFLSRQDATVSLFGKCRGAHFCQVDDLDATAAAIARELERGVESVAEVLEDRDRLRAAFGWESTALKKWQALASAWFERKVLALSA